MNNIKKIRKHVGDLLEADAELASLQVKIYKARELPGTFDRELCVFSFGTYPNKGTSLEGNTVNPFYQFAFQWLVKFESNTLAAAEDVADDIENIIYRIFLVENPRNTFWRKVTFPTISLRPLAPGGTQNVHYGRTTVRLTPTV